MRVQLQTHILTPYDTQHSRQMNLNENQTPLRHAKLMIRATVWIYTA